MELPNHPTVPNSDHHFPRIMSVILCDSEKLLRLTPEAMMKRIDEQGKLAVIARTIIQEGGYGWEKVTTAYNEELAGGKTIFPEKALSAVCAWLITAQVSYQRGLSVNPQPSLSG